MRLKRKKYWKKIKPKFVSSKLGMKPKFVLLKKNKFNNNNSYWLWNLNKIDLTPKWWKKKKKFSIHERWSNKNHINVKKKIKFPEDFVEALKKFNFNKIKKSIKKVKIKSNVYKNILENNTSTSYKIPLQNWKNYLWKSVRKYCDSKELLQWDEYSDEDKIETVRNTAFKLPIGLSFKGIVKYIDLPINFGLKKFEILRYNSDFYGYNYQANLFSYNLWLTMGLKKNIAVPFNLYYHTNNPRKNFLASINKFSWKYYSYLIKNSFIKKKFDIILDNIDLNLYTDYLSDISIWNCRKKFNLHRALSLIHDDFDYSVSTYHNKFYYYDYRSRSQFFWISNNATLRNPTFYITSFDVPVLLLPRKYLKSLSLLSKITKFHRSWNFISKNVYEDKIIINKTLLLLWQNFMIQYYKIKINLLINLNKILFSFFKLILFKSVHLLNLKCNYILKKCNYILKKNFSRSILLLSFYNKNFRFNLNMNKFLVNFNNIFNIKKKKLLIFHLLLLLKKNNKKKINKLTNIYFKSHGFFKFSIKRSLILKRGTVKLQSLGTKHSLQILNRPRLFYNEKFFYFNFVKIPEKALIVQEFSQQVFQFLFCFIQNSFNLNLNFLNLNIIEDFNFQLYVFLYNFFEFSDAISTTWSWKKLYFKFFYKRKYNYRIFFYIKKIFNKNYNKKLLIVDNLKLNFLGAINYLSKKKIICNNE